MKRNRYKATRYVIHQRCKVCNTLTHPRDLTHGICDKADMAHSRAMNVAENVGTFAPVRN